ncbi:hypothetical protein CEXT_322801 [Caerostris extrusa]|uniref:Uncharacterized protein n=1 Tax=Caerostris extrusa TaxID=172846 RepID=A0AAV4Y774_CAEEX|nr:hypothetical protein CEXT_322801 [Caerostris extrusa]
MHFPTEKCIFRREADRIHAFSAVSLPSLRCYLIRAATVSRQDPLPSVTSRIIRIAEGSMGPKKVEPALRNLSVPKESIIRSHYSNSHNHRHTENGFLIQIVGIILMLLARNGWTSWNMHLLVSAALASSFYSVGIGCDICHCNAECIVKLLFADSFTLSVLIIVLLKL